MAERIFRIDFYQVTLTATGQIPDPDSGFRWMLRNRPLQSDAAGMVRDIYGLSANRTGIQGQLRKFRMDDFPEVGSIGRDAAQLDLDEDQGLVEKNYFRFEPDSSVLAWHSNSHGSTPNQFAKVLRDIWGTKVKLLPLVKGNAARRILAGQVDVKRVDLSIPVPTNPDYFPANDFSRSMIDLLRSAGGDRLKIQISADARRVNPGERASLSRGIKRGIAELVTDGAASIAKVEAYEEGNVVEPIDLVAERVYATQVIDHVGKYPAPARMYQALRDSFNDVQGELDEYFGTPDRRLRG